MHTEVILIGKPECHLCDVALAVIEDVLGNLPEQTAAEVGFTELSIQDDPQLYAKWWEKIPVVLINGTLHTHWRVSPDAFRQAIVSAINPS